MAARRSLLCSLISPRRFFFVSGRSETVETLTNCNFREFPSLPPLGPIPPHSMQKCDFVNRSEYVALRGFSTTARVPPKFSIRIKEEDSSTDEEKDGREDDEDEDEEEEEDDDASDEGAASNCAFERERSDAEKLEEAAGIGYRVIGQLQESERVVKRWRPVFAVIQIGSHQFKVCIGDCIYTEKLKWCEVNDQLALNKVLMLGSQTRTVIGRPTLPAAEVCAVVEEHAKDAKVIIFKKKRRKNYRRTKGHRQELTRLRITAIRGIDKPHHTTMAI